MCLSLNETHSVSIVPVATKEQSLHDGKQELFHSSAHVSRTYSNSLPCAGFSIARGDKIANTTIDCKHTRPEIFY